MKRAYFNTENDGFYGAYYKDPKTCDKIADFMVKIGVNRLHRNGCNVSANIIYLPPL